MFDQLLEESVVQGEIITAAVGHQGGEVATDAVVAEGLIAARRLFADPQHVERLVTRMEIYGPDKSCPWW